MRAVRHIFLAGLGAAAIAAAAGAQEYTVVYDDTPGFGNPGNAYRIPDDDGAGFDYRIDYCPSCSEAVLPGGSHGMLIGTGLFQSLLRFDVNDGDTATFAASEFAPGEVDTYIENVFARVTGDGDESIIRGRIRNEIGSSNLFLLNPHGVLFGEDASLDVGGSFHVTTADYLRFENNQTFEARLGGAVPMEIAPAVAFGFLNDGGSPATITFDGTGADVFAVPGGETLSAVAGRVEVIGGGSADQIATLGSNGGLIQLAAVPAGTEVPTNVEDLAADTLGSDEASVRLANNAIVEVSGSGPGGPGRIVIRGGRFEMVREGGTESGRVSAASTGASSGDPPSIDIEVAGPLALDDGDITSTTTGVGPGTSGGIRLVSGSMSLDNGSNVLSSIGGLFHAGSGPDIDVETGDLTISGASRIQSSDDTNLGSTSGKVGDIRVDVNSVLVTGAGSEIASTRKGTGDGATIRVEAATSVDLASGGRIIANRLAGGIPGGTPTDPGRIEVQTESLSVTSGSEILSSTATAFEGSSIAIGSEAAPVETVTVTAGAIGSVTTGSGKGGDVTVHAGHILLSSDPDIPGSTGQISAVTQGPGPGGNLNVYADSTDLVDGGQMSTSTEAGAGPAGDLSVEVAGRLFASGVTIVGSTPASSGLFSRGADADGGNLTVTADSIQLERGADLSTSVTGIGKPGDMLLTARSISVTGGAVTPTSIAAKSDDGEGAGGALTIDTETLAVTAGGEITTSTTGERNAGDMQITARDILVAGTDELGFNRSGITSRALQNSTGRAGSVTLQPHAGERLTARIRDRGRVSVESTGLGAAGDLLFTGADLIEVSHGGEISATVGDVFTDDPGGPAAVASDIRIRDAGTVRVNGGRITAATSGSGFGGLIDIQAENIALQRGAQVTSASTGENGGDAGWIRMAAWRNFTARNSEITTTAEDAGGGRISIQAGKEVSLVESRIETTVRGAEPNDQDAGDIDIPFRGDEDDGVDPVVPEFVVINDSIIRANANATDAGDITIAGDNVLISSDSVIEATSETGIDGEVDISSPDSDISSQVAPLPVNFVDASDRLLPPCIARTERTGSFVVEGRGATRPSPDSPLSPTLAQPGRPEPRPPGGGLAPCPDPEDNS